MDESSQVPLNNPFQIMCQKSSNPESGEMVFDHNKGCVEIFDGNTWKEVSNQGEVKPSLLDAIIKHIKEADADEIKTLLNNFDKFKSTLEKEYLCKC